MYSITTFLQNHQPKNNKFFIIAIDGRGGSGKTAFAEYFQTLLPDFIFLNGDDYFEPVENQIVWGAFNDKRLEQDVIKPLQNSNTFTYRPYDWGKDPHISQKEIIVQKGICLERCFSFTFDLDWDLKIWVETPKDICLQRGIAREHMPKERVLAAWKDVWQSAEDEYIEKTKPQQQATIIIDGTKPFTEQLVK